MNNSQIMDDSIFKIGRVLSVEGRKVKIKVNKNKNESYILYKGDLIKNISVGSYIKIIKGFTKIIGKVEGEYIEENKAYSLKEYNNPKDKINRTLSVSMLGFFKNSKFERGIKELPLVYNECFLLSKEEFMSVHNFIKNDDEPLKIGRLSLEKGQEINLGVNSLFASHIGVFGNTGSGKSYTLAKIYEKLFEKYKDNDNFKKNSKFYFFDFNGEYLNNSDQDNDNVIVEKKYKNVYNLSTRTVNEKFPVDEKEVNDVNFWAIYLSATEKTQTPFLKRALNNNFYFERFDNDDNFKFCIRSIITTLIINKKEKGDILNFLMELKNSTQNENNIQILVDDYQKHLKWHSMQEKYYYESTGLKIFEDLHDFIDKIITRKVNNLNFKTIDTTYLEKIRLKIIFQYYHELAKFGLNSEHISPLLKRLKKIEDLNKVLEIKISIVHENDSKNINIISLKDVNTEMKKVLPLLICKQIYDEQKQKQNKTNYLNIIIDEAHNILSHISNRESETWKDYRLETFEEIIKEGRKFGVFLTISSQRPSDISSTIISQLHNYFLHRLINNNDILAVEKTISYLDKVSFEYLPILPTGTCILAGLAAQVPVVIDISKIKDGHEPKSETIKLTNNWC